MMGKDAERLVAGIDAVRQATCSALVSLANGSSYAMQSTASHAGKGYGSCTPVEKEHPAGDAMSGITAAMSSLNEDIGKMNAMDDNLYSGSGSFYNSIGSPWKEIRNLQSSVQQLSAYNGNTPFNYVGQKAGMLAMLNMVISMCVDAKWAVIYYHDYIQRGYDTMYNGNTASVTITTGIDGQQSIGNIQQQFEENVHISEPSIDPY